LEPEERMDSSGLKNQVGRAPKRKGRLGLREKERIQPGKQE